jgi:periplasmic protein TonB
MAKVPPSQRFSTPSGRFWGNVVLIALAHVALIAGLIRWSVAAKASSNPESIVWLGGAGDLSADESEKKESPSAKQPTVSESESVNEDEAKEEKPVVTTAKSEIELPSATPKPTATATPAKPSVTPAPKATPKLAAKPARNATHSVAGGPTPKKNLLAKASPKPVAKPKPSPAKAKAKSEKTDKITLAKKDSASQSGSEQSGSTGKAGSVGGGSTGSEFGWYGNMLHDRFYSAWIQPTTNVPSGSKISTLVNVRIEKDGRISKFEIAKPSGNATVNESVAAVAKQISQVDPPPTGLIKGDHYDVKINFELNTEEKPPN